MKPRSLIFACAGALAFLPSRLWAAPERPTDGLVMWLDAAGQNALRQKFAQPAVAAGQAVDTVLDASPGRRDFFQPVADRRPLLLSEADAALWRFDGKDDFLAASLTPKLTAELTVIVLAAPRANPGWFSGVFATSAAGVNDFTHGLNLDFGPLATDTLSVVNVESAGAGGARNLIAPSDDQAAHDRPFGKFHVITVRSRVGMDGTEVFLNGVRSGTRDRLESLLGLDRMIVGARIYSNDPAMAPFVQGHFHGDIAAVAAYDRALTDAERSAVEEEFLSRRPALEALAAGTAGHGLQTVDHPPVVQVLAPGFSVHEVPLQLGNLTSVRYRHDGVCVALGYDGRIHLLSDTDGDGIPDAAAVWWDHAPLMAPIGMALLPANDPRGEGAFVASKAKLSLILDRNRDGIADEERVAATGWPETFHGVDTLGVAVHPVDGSIYFSIGCTNFVDAYLKNPAGVAQYDRQSPRGTVQRLSADFGRLETVATGVRFLCALAFNRHGDLFATDQEGATWLPNGNPFDELLHIVPGRHYGFPPRHPRHLPDVLDEPSTFDYGPQHQSTCGLVFNEGVNGGPAFGPAHWHGDAIVCGQSRGKLWRTKLVKSPEGYVAQTHLFACLNLLTVDACVTPRGDLLVACHSGPPDWGTGPAGDGRLFLIKWANPEAPQPVVAWAAAPDEFRIAFDAPMALESWRGAKPRIRVEAGAYVSPGDRFETVRPGYQVVRDQLSSPRRWIEVLDLSLTADGRTLALKVPVQQRPEPCAITLPAPDAWLAESPVPQIAEIDVAVTQNGLQVAGDPRVVLPHPTPDVSKQLTVGSAEHEAFFAAPPAIIEMAGLVDVSNIFHPQTQPGSALDYDVARDAFANRQMRLVEPQTGRAVPLTTAGSTMAMVRAAIPAGQRLAFELDGHLRPVALNRVWLPWVTPDGDRTSGEAPLAAARTDVSGNWLRGRRLYFEKAACFTCHTIRGEGLSCGPDLSNLVHRDRQSVWADITAPSAAINPDHAGTAIHLHDGRILHGLIAATNEQSTTLLMPAGVRQEVAAADIQSIAPMKTSLMPEGLVEALSESEREDLITFLLTSPLEPAVITRTDPAPPAPRRLDEVARYLPAPGQQPATRTPLRILLSAAAKDHGIDEHDYPLWLERWSTLLQLAEGVSVSTCMGFPTDEALADADVTVMYSNNAGWDLGAARRLDRYQQRGGGLVCLHWAIEGHRNPKELADRVGLAFSTSAFRHGEMTLEFSPIPHPVIAGFNHPIQFIDESYWKLHGDPGRLGVLATSREDGQPTPQIWVREADTSRVFGCIPGHYTWTFDDPLYRVLVLRGICWAAGETDIDRLAELATVGARLQP